MFGFVLAGSATGTASAAASFVSRDEYLAHVAGCVECHTSARSDQPGAPLSGGRVFGKGAQAVVAANITPDRSTGIGAWTDRQIADAIKRGVTPEGRRLRAPMPQTAYHALRDVDVDALVAYLRGRPAIAREAPNSAAPRGKTAIADPAAASDREGQLVIGNYLATAVTHRTECHRIGPDLAPDDGERSGKGGVRIFHTATGNVVSPALTPTRLGTFSNTELARLITTGVRPDGKKPAGPMPVAAYANLTSDDLGALIEFLRKAHRP